VAWVVDRSIDNHLSADEVAEPAAQRIARHRSPDGPTYHKADPWRHRGLLGRSERVHDDGASTGAPTMTNHVGEISRLAQSIRRREHSEPA
jgi:hypothetical protein